MTDWINAAVEAVNAPGFIKTLVDHNRGFFLGIIVAAAATIPMACSGMKTTSPISGKMVTQDQLDAEASIAARDLTTQQAILTAKAADLKDKLGPAYADLQRKQQAVQTVMGTITGLINTYVPGPWQGVAGVGMTAVMLGLGLDNRRKDALIRSPDQPPMPVYAAPAPTPLAPATA